MGGIKVFLYNHITVVFKRNVDVCLSLKSGDAAVLHMLQNKDNDPYRFVCHSIISH